ncbi:hypothetical protein BOSEA31B_11824 [Hyphomicrobiales bacterium]|nr:hypothetical protein BOSEA31B_11824 [Hyphomicrobiales bacterium]CAH1697604.1 hypothetical protein BOSEA1005_10649 [Hyphomicrobiales bacterium]CAI0347251.1 hypothetical protein BO1005MUT1_70032 [Hyphomicrobiales bacterium]
MSNLVSSSRHASRSVVFFNPGWIAVSAVGTLWAAALLLRLFGADPIDSVTACRHAFYRDPLIGQERSIGPARLAPDGAMTCAGVTYRATVR